MTILFIASSSNFLKQKKNNNKWKECQPPRRLAFAILGSLIKTGQVFTTRCSLTRVIKTPLCNQDPIEPWCEYTYTYKYRATEAVNQLPRSILGREYSFVLVMICSVHYVKAWVADVKVWEKFFSFKTFLLLYSFIYWWLLEKNFREESYNYIFQDLGYDVKLLFRLWRRHVRPYYVLWKGLHIYGESCLISGSLNFLRSFFAIKIAIYGSK